MNPADEARPAADGRRPSVRPARRRAVRFVVAGLVLLLAAAVMFDEAWIRPLAQRYVRERADRQLDFDGIAFRIDASGRPLLRLRGLTLENAPWAASRDPLIRAGEVEVVFDWTAWPGRDRIWIDRLRLVDATLDLEREADGRRNWRIARPEHRGAGRVRVRRLETVRTTIVVRQRALDLELRLASEPLPVVAASTTARPDRGAQPLAQRIAIDGRRAGVAFAGRIDASERLTLFDTGESFAWQGELTSGGARLALDGVAADLFGLGGFDLALSAEGARGLGPLAAIAGGARARAAAWPTLASEVRVGRLSKVGTLWTLDGLSATLGRSDLAGRVELHDVVRQRDVPSGGRTGAIASAASAPAGASTSGTVVVPETGASTAGRTVDESAERLRVVATLTGRRIDADELRRAFAARENGPAAADASERSTQKAGNGATGDRARPGASSSPPEPVWRRIDADLDLRVARIDGLPTGPASDARLQASGRAGLWRLPSLSLAVAGGRASGEGTFDGRRSPADLALDLRLAALDLRRIGVEQADGSVDARLTLRTTGDTADAWTEAADGRLRGHVDRLTIDARLAAKLALDGGRWLRTWFGGADRVVLDCAAFDIRLDDGVAAVRLLAIDAADWWLGGSGRVDLARRTVDLRLTPERKRFALLAVDRSIRIHGPLAKPSVALVDRPAGSPPRCVRPSIG